ncbi:phosphoheptose isomerase [Fodinibius sp.]|uniref:phosphoheptose isomerase n=1 Tax=Fodinibius sp. TaxID=1872440 RepID=UPI00356510FD
MRIPSEKQEVFEEVAQKINNQGFTIVDQDRQRPWGGFFVIDEQQAQEFASTYFPHLSMDDLTISGKLSPKVLMVAPGKRLSWQYHHRRAEIWKVIKGPAGVVTSETDEQGNLEEYDSGDVITLRQGERHRLVGLDNWGVLAEIWQHTDPAHPSDEDDIVRLQDDFGR